MRVGLLLCIVAIVLGVGASHARADRPPPPTMIADGVQIGSVAVGGLTGAEATAAVQQVYFARVVLKVGHHLVSISPHHFHTSRGLATAVQTAPTPPPG